MQRMNLIGLLSGPLDDDASFFIRKIVIGTKINHVLTVRPHLVIRLLVFGGKELGDQFLGGGQKERSSFRGLGRLFWFVPFLLENG